MHVEKPAVTLRDKKKAKTTIKIFGCFAAFFTIVSGLAIGFTPRAKTIKGIDNDESQIIENLNSINYGEEFAVISKDTFQRYETKSGKCIETFNYVDLIYNKVSNDGKYFNKNAFSNPTFHYENVSENHGYILAFDDNGDCFKFTYDDGVVALTDDYFLTDSYTIKENGQDKTYVNKYVIRTLYVDSADKNNPLVYVLCSENNLFEVNVLEVNDLASGIKKSKHLYSFKKPSDSQIEEIEDSYRTNVKKVLDLDTNLRYDNTPFYIMDPISSSTTGGENPYNVFVRDGKLFILTSSGVHVWDLDFSDFDNTSIYNNVYDSFVNKMRDELLTISNETKTKFGISEELFSSLNTASNFVIKGLYTAIFSNSDDYFLNLKQYAAEITNSSSFMAYYDPNLAYLSHAVFASSIDEKSKNIFITKDNNKDSSQTLTLDGMVYSPINDKVYLINDKDNYLYSISREDLLSFSLLDVDGLVNKAKKTSVYFKNKEFFANRGAITYDRVANSIHVTFLNDRNLCIVDLTEDDASIRTMLKFKYDIAGFDEVKDGSRIIVKYKTDKVTIRNERSNPNHIGVINPNTYKYRTFVIVLAIIFIVLLIVSIIVIILALKAFKKEKTMLKMKVIKRDLKRNKWTYISLIPFIILLIMFCYVEAVGSISFSFFSYTMEHPSYIWNDFGNYINIFHDSQFWLMFGNTLFFLVFDLFFGIVPPIIFAFFLSIIKNKKLSGVLRALMFIPAIVPGIATLLIWRFGIFGNTGVLNQLICLLRTGHTTSPDYTPIEFLIDPSKSRWSLLLMGFPYVGGYLIFYGGLMNIPKEYDEACQLEGLGVIKRFFKIDLPLISPQIKYIFVMGILSSAQNYERTYMLGSTGTITLVESMYRQMKEYSNYGLASAYATIIFLLLLVPVLINFKDTRKNNLGDQI